MKDINYQVLLAVTAVICLTSCNSAQHEQKKNTPIKVMSEVVHTLSESDTKSYVGIVEEESSISASFNGSGTIAKVYVCEGQSVKRGDPIAEIDKTQALNMLSSAQAQMTQANDAFSRLKKLHDNNSLPEMEWIEIQSKVQQAGASLDMAKKAVEDCSIFAPESGIIGKGVMNVGEVVLPALPVAKILVIDNVKIRASIPEKEIGTITSSTTSRIIVDALSAQSYKGERIEKCIDANNITHTYDIKVSVRNNNHTLLPGMVAKVELANPSEEEIITVPISSVRKGSKGEHYIWTNVDGKANRAIITVGKPSGNRIIVKSGLKPGDVIITEGYQKLSEGMEII